jgi:hypothetical protein
MGGGVDVSEAIYNQSTLVLKAESKRAGLSPTTSIFLTLTDHVDKMMAFGWPATKTGEGFERSLHPMEESKQI